MDLKTLIKAANKDLSRTKNHGLIYLFCLQLEDEFILESISKKPTNNSSKLNHQMTINIESIIYKIHFQVTENGATIKTIEIQ